jgi:hypothetical protein
MPNVPKQQPGNIGNATQSASTSPVAEPVPDVAEVQATLQAAKYVLEAALQQVLNGITSGLAACTATQQSAIACIGKLVSDQFSALYSTYYGSQQIVKDNLGYLLSAAGQYAALLGYPGINVDTSGIPADVSRTMDVNTGTGRNLNIQTQPIASGQATVIPRDVGWVQGDMPNPQLGTYDNNVGSQISGSGVAGAQQIPLPISGVIPSQNATAASGASGGMGPVPASPPASTPQSISPVSTGSISPVTVGGIPAPQGLSTVGNVPIPFPMPGQLVSPKGSPGATRSIKSGIASTGNPPVIAGLGTTGLASQPTQSSPGPVVTPTPSGCPTSTAGLPTWTDFLPFGSVMPRNGMWLACGQVLAQITTDQAAAATGNVCFSTTVDGIAYWGIARIDCNAANPPQPTSVSPSPTAEPSPSAPDTCNNLSADQSQWTPWQQANCGTGTIAPTQSCPAPTVSCPAPIVSLPTGDLCNCIQAALNGVEPDPIDLDEPLAFKYSPDDVAWKQNAIAFSGGWLEAYNNSSSAEQFRDAVFSSYPEVERLDVSP